MWLQSSAIEDHYLLNEDPFGCDGCHEGSFSDFDHFCDVLNVTDEEAPHAFAAWLGHETKWNGEYGFVEDTDTGVV